MLIAVFCYIVYNAKEKCTDYLASSGLVARENMECYTIREMESYLGEMRGDVCLAKLIALQFEGLMA